MSQQEMATHKKNIVFQLEKPLVLNGDEIKAVCEDWNEIAFKLAPDTLLNRLGRGYIVEFLAFSHFLKLDSSFPYHLSCSYTENQLWIFLDAIIPKTLADKVYQQYQNCIELLNNYDRDKIRKIRKNIEINEDEGRHFYSLFSFIDLIRGNKKKLPTCQIAPYDDEYVRFLVLSGRKFYSA
ncbi:MAG: hypothetical protein AAF740_10045 [Bacteroidota bacterium]